MKKTLSMLSLIVMASLCCAQSVVINKIYNSGTTSPAGQDDVVELLVISDHLDMRNFIIKDFSGGGSSATEFLDAGGKFVFKDIPLWRTVRAGTVIVLRKSPSAANYVEDIDPTDKVLDLKFSNSAYFTTIDGSFNITNYDMLMIKSGSSLGIDNAIHTVAFGLVNSNTTYNAIGGAKMSTDKISPTAGFLYPASSTVSLSDYNSTGGLLSSTTSPIALTWGVGSGVNNVAFIAYIRSLGDYGYVHTSGDEQIEGAKSFSGSLSIGTVDPKGYKLAVAGNIIAEEIKVKLQGNWPDFVFSRSHRVLPLAEVERYISDQGHLPGIPSAEAVKRDGIDLASMDAKLLQKIEELTLYLIDLQKQVQMQNAIIKQLKSKITAKK